MATLAAKQAPALPPAAADMRVGGLGLGLGVLAFALFSCMDGLIKWLSAGYPVHQMVFLNSMFSLVPVVVWTWRRGALAGVWRTRRLGLHLLRGCCGMAGASLAFYAYSQMPLTDAYAIIFTTPLLITALSLPVLGERVGWRRWTAILVGFLGVLVMLRPGMQAIGLGAIAALGAACASAFAVLLVRKLSATETTGSIALYANLTIIAVTGALLPFSFVMPSFPDLMLFAAAGLLGGTALIALISAYRYAPAALVAPFQYSQMLWGALLGLVIWGHVPDRAVILGAVIVAASGLFILYRETTLGRRPTASLHPSAAAKDGSRTAPA